MSKITKIVASASVLGIMGVAILPVASSYAATTGNTQVQVTVDETCIVGDTAGNAANNPSPLLQLSLSASTPYGQVSSNGTAGNGNIGVTCNSANGWGLLQEVDHEDLQLGGNGATGFTEWTQGSTPSDFAANTWGMKYSGNGVWVDATDTSVFHDPNSVHKVAQILDNSIPQTTITQTFGAKTDGTLPQGTYSAIITYTLSAR